LEKRQQDEDLYKENDKRSTSLGVPVHF
jgi:hypothetical protein